MPSGARWRVLADERGIALVLALGILIVLTILSTSVFTYTTANSHASRLSQERSTGWAIAEAGINAASTILNDPSKDVRKPDLLSCSGSTCTTTVAGGYAVWQGTLIQPTLSDTLSCIDPNDPAYDPNTCPYWIVTSTGYVRNPDAGTPASKTAIVKVSLVPKPVPPLDMRAWDQIMSTQAPSPEGICDETIRNSGTISSPLYVMGNLCLQQTVSVTQAPLNVRGSISLDNPNAIVGSSSRPLSYLSPGGSVHIGGNCQYSNNKFNSGFHPCGTTGAGWPQDNIYADGPNNSPDPTINPPTINWAGWYGTASPGPAFPCLAPTGPLPVYNGVFGDNDAVVDNNSLANAPFNLTPTTNYNCSTDYGSVKWTWNASAATGTLCINGAVFIDGSASIIGPQGNFYATLDGNCRGVLYLAGDFFVKNAVVCVQFNANHSDCNTTTWDPNKTLLAIVTQGKGGQPSTNMNPADGVQLVSSTFQGAAFALANFETDTSSKFYGPMLGNQVKIGQSVNTQFPPITISDFAFNQGGTPPMKTNGQQYLNG